MACPRLSVAIVLVALLPCLHINFEVNAQSKDSTNSQPAVEQPPDVEKAAVESNPQKRSAPENPSVQDPNKFAEVNSLPAKRDTAAQPVGVEDLDLDLEDETFPQKREADAAKPVAVADLDDPSLTGVAGNDEGPLPESAVEPRQIDWDDDDITTYPLPVPRPKLPVGWRGGRPLGPYPPGLGPGGILVRPRPRPPVGPYLPWWMQPQNGYRRNIYRPGSYKLPLGRPRYRPSYRSTNPWVGGPIRPQNKLPIWMRPQNSAYRRYGRPRPLPWRY